MPKKSNKDEATASGIVNRDIIQRLNFLYQASVCLNAIPEAAKPKSGKNKRLDTRNLAKFYIADMQAVGQKTTVKIDPNVKRTICRGCNATLIPGTTASIRVKKSKSHANIMVYTCNECKTSKRIPAPPVPQEELLGPQTQSEPDSSRNPDRGTGEAQRHNQNSAHSEANLAVASLADDSMQDGSNQPNIDHHPSSSFSSSFMAPVTVASPHSYPTPSHNLPLSASTYASSTQQSHHPALESAQFKQMRPELISGKRARLPPHFARDAGHVVFVGNERLPELEESQGSGIYIS